MFIRWLEMVRRQADGKRRHARLQLRLHEARNHGLRHEIVPVDPANWHGLEEAITSRGEFRTTPAMLAREGGLDGFYACVIAKT